MDCDEGTISSGRLIGPTGSYWNCVYGCGNASSLASTEIYCTSFSVEEDWSQGENTFIHTFPGPGPFVVR